MKKLPSHILRIGLGITFIWIGVFIFREPEAWGSFLQPWAVELLPAPIREIMIGTAFFDMAIGLLLLIDVFTWFTATLGALHLLSILITVGVDSITVRNIGLLAGAIALAIDRWPDNLKQKI